jgi:dipeptidyl aminopeptidase/acylaminoacyl peptidase
MRLSLPGAVLLVASTAIAQRPIQLDDFSRFTEVSDPHVSPDGQWVLYTVATTDVTADKRVTRLAAIKWDGSEKLPITDGEDSASNARWSPDGRYVSFLSSRGGGKATGSQIWLLDRRGGEPQQLTELKERISSYEWSPDSRRLVLILPALAEEGGGGSGRGGGRRGADTAAPPEPSKPIVIDRFEFKRDVAGYRALLQAFLLRHQRKGRLYLQRPVHGQCFRRLSDWRHPHFRQWAGRSQPGPVYDGVCLWA